MADESNEGAVTYKLRKFTETDQVNLILDSIPEACKTVVKIERALQDLKGNFMFVIRQSQTGKLDKPFEWCPRVFSRYKFLCPWNRQFFTGENFPAPECLCVLSS